MNRSDAQPPLDEYDQRPSKTQRKKDSHALQVLGEQLVELGPERLKAFALPEDLAGAIRELHRIHAHEGRRRQMQWIGKLMRNLDEAQIDRLRADFDAVTRQSREDTARLHALERWRERLLADDEALTAWIAEHPGCEVQTLRNLIRSARKEQAQAKPPRIFRELFQFLKTATEAGAAAATPSISADQAARENADD